MPSPTIFYPGVNPIHRDMPNSGSGAALLENNNLSDVQSAATSRANLGIDSTLIGTLYASWFANLPTAPSGSPGWWNNGGVPSYS